MVYHRMFLIQKLPPCPMCPLVSSCHGVQTQLGLRQTYRCRQVKCSMLVRAEFSNASWQKPPLLDFPKSTLALSWNSMYCVKMLIRAPSDRLVHAML
mmetsp:Transcript_40267/g.110804  ORF Transcript_40267/g.110804 Transcript_40267/m.110804 type:complete len:97 (-) Transcript_40267:1316-1606(-)